MSSHKKANSRLPLLTSPSPPGTDGYRSAISVPSESKGNDPPSSGRERENDSLLGWGKHTTGSGTFASGTSAKNKRSDNLTGGTSGHRGTATYTEGPLGGHSRSRMASYDSATTLGLPRYTCVFVDVDELRVDIVSWSGGASVAILVFSALSTVLLGRAFKMRQSTCSCVVQRYKRHWRSVGAQEVTDVLPKFRISSRELACLPQS